MPVTPPPKRSSSEALLLAVEDGEYAAVRRLVEQGADIEVRDANGNTPLNLAAAFGYLDITRYLIDHKANVDTRNAKGETPLISAVSKYGSNRDSIVRLLLEKDANPDIKDNNGKTAEMIATEKNRGPLVVMLKNASAKRAKLAEEFAKAAEAKRHAEIQARQQALREKAKNVPRIKPGPKPPKAA